MTCLEYNEALQELAQDSEVVVGSGAQATWRVRNVDLLPKHFVVTSTATGSRIRTFSSDAVVAINGRQVSSSAIDLKDGDVIEAGSARFYFWKGAPKKHEDANDESPSLTAHLVDTRRRSAHAIDRHSVGIGRDESNSLVVDSETASRFHAEIRREAGGHALRTMGSARATVNGQPVTAPVLLNEGDELQIADRVLRYTRDAVPMGISLVPPHAILESARTTHPTWSTASPTPAIVPQVPMGGAARMPARTLALVSVIAAVAIATFLFLHRMP